MMLDKVIEPDSLRVSPNGDATLGLRLPWYRALPLSTVELDALTIDGEAVTPDRVTLSLNGGSWPVAELRRRTDQNWFVTDTATLTIADAGLSPNSEHEVGVTLSLYPPYIRGLRRATRWSRTMEAR